MRSVNLILVAVVASVTTLASAVEPFKPASEFESVLVLSSERDHVAGHSDGQISVKTPDVDMYQSMREPIVTRTNSGRIVCAVQAGNRIEWPERSGQDIVLTYSDDHGATWSAPRLVSEDGVHSLQSVGLVYDAEVDRLIFLYTSYRWDYSGIEEGRGTEVSAPLIQKTLDAGEPLHKEYMVVSDDDGETWGSPKEITQMVTRGEAWGHFGASEGRQLTVGDHRGRLVVPGGLRFEDDSGKTTRKVLHVWLSDDHGETWRPSETILDTPNERQYSCEARVTELPDGSLLYNSRTRYDGRHQSRSLDGGKTWTELSRANELIATQCNGSLITLSNEKDELTNTLLISLPLPKGRNNGVIYRSDDKGESWPTRYDIMPGFFAYSALLQLDHEHVALFYETKHYRDIRMVRLSLSSDLEVK